MTWRSESRVGASAPADLTRFAWLSIGAAAGTLTLKSLAALLTGSVGLLSDAAESVVNLAAAVIALLALRIAARPPDEGHNFGHGKVEYLSASVEAVMIFVAALGIMVTALQRLIDPRPLESVGPGLLVSAVAGLVNGAVAVTLIRAGRRHGSLTLTADGKHLMTDVWTSVGVIVGVVLVAVTGYLRLDPLVALLVGANIVVTGVGLLRNALAGLMDKAISTSARAELDRVLDEFTRQRRVSVHSVRTRAMGRENVVSVHLVVPAGWSIEQAHELTQDLEVAVASRLRHTHVQTHVEPEGHVHLGDRPAPGGEIL